MAESRRIVRSAVAVILFPVARRHSVTAALGFVASRVTVVEAREPVVVGESGEWTIGLSDGHYVIQCDHR